MPNSYLARLPEYRYPDNALLKTEGASNALQGYLRGRERLAGLQQQDDQNQLQRDRFGHEQEKDRRDTRDKQVKAIAGQAQLIDEERDPVVRTGLWRKLRATYPGFDDALKEHGIDPEDHANGPKFLVAQAQGPRDHLKDEATRAEIGVRNAHAGYYKKAGEALATKADAAKDNAATRRVALYSDMLGRLGENPTQADWERESQPGGFLHAAFGGQVPTFDRAPFILAQAKREVSQNFEPTEEDRISGITREDKIRAFRQNRINEMYGVEPKTLFGKGVRLKPGGDFEEIPGGKETQGDRQAKSIAFAALGTLQEAEKYFQNPGAPGSGPQGYVTQGIGQATGHGDAGRALKASRMAITDLVFAISGKQVSNKEREAFIEMYAPQWTDTQYQQLWKLRQVRRYFDAVLKARDRQASDEEIADLFRRGLMDRPGDVDVKGGKKAPAQDGGWSIRRLQ